MHSQVQTYNQVRAALATCLAGEFRMGMVCDGSVSVTVRSPHTARRDTSVAIEALTNAGLRTSNPAFDEPDRHFQTGWFNVRA
jgi:hypothetical protein